jgi:hypothetical protein
LADGEFWRPSVLCRPVAHATGRAGDVFLCHPFIVHSATWPHRGTSPRMIAQPAVHVRDGFAIDGSDPSPVAEAIVAGLAMAGRLGWLAAPARRLWLTAMCGCRPMPGLHGLPAARTLP